MMDFSILEKNCNYTFKDKELLRKALTLSSYDNGFNNEALECLGDALLSFIVAEKYYNEGATEEGITDKKRQLISDEALAPVSKRLAITHFLLCGKGDTNNKKAVPSAYEALTAAIYLDGGLEEARRFALSTLTPLPVQIDYISRVQEILQSCGESAPTYEKEEGGTPQKPHFKVTVAIHGKIFNGEGDSVSEAKKSAAKAAYEYLKIN